MPAKNGTGPTGQGAGTGHGMSKNRGQGRGRMGGPYSAGPKGYCICPNCSHKEPHVLGQPCNQKQCPKCNTVMIRE